jgi:hypothetical protein
MQANIDIPSVSFMGYSQIKMDKCRRPQPMYLRGHGYPAQRKARQRGFFSLRLRRKVSAECICGEMYAVQFH